MCVYTHTQYFPHRYLKNIIIDSLSFWRVVKVGERNSHMGRKRENSEEEKIALFQTPRNSAFPIVRDFS